MIDDRRKLRRIDPASVGSALLTAADEESLLWLTESDWEWYMPVRDESIIALPSEVAFPRTGNRGVLYPLPDPARELVPWERAREEFGGLRWGSAFFGWLVEEGEIKQSPLRNIKPPRIPDEPPDVLTDDGIDPARIAVDRVQLEQALGARAHAVAARGSAGGDGRGQASTGGKPRRDRGCPTTRGRGTASRRDRGGGGEPTRGSTGELASRADGPSS